MTRVPTSVRGRRSLASGGGVLSGRLLREHERWAAVERPSSACLNDGAST